VGQFRDPVKIDHHRRDWMQLCGRCNHPCDHVGERCENAVTLRRQLSPEEKEQLGTEDDFEFKTAQCPCTGAVRTDAHANHQLALALQKLDMVHGALIDLGNIIMFASGIEVNPETGELRQKSGIVLPR
jgi:hypothetical protein